MRRVNLILLAGIVFVAAVSFAEPWPLNGVAAIVNDSIITLQQVREAALAAIDALPRPPLISKEMFEKKRDDAWNESLDALVTKQLILDDFKNAGGKMPESLLDDEINSRIRKRWGDRATLIKSLQAQGINIESYRQQQHDLLILEYMRYKNVSQNILISPQKVESYYHTNVSTYQVGEQIKLRVIVLNSPVTGMADEIKRMAQEILRKIDDGADFAEMASVYSEGSQRGEGGDWGWRDRKFLMRGLSDIAFSLKAGQHSSVVGRAMESDQSYWILPYDPAGNPTQVRKYSPKDELLDQAAPANTTLIPQEYYLMLVEDKRTAHTRPLEEVRDEIEKTLLAQERARLIKKWIDRLRTKSFVRYF